ncbi:hypothetical protein BJY01DRAFT_255497 [Aspergillus pseudoustus]|uniref:Extracellular membrane protein CFEM domain-containing protein n=1 Tax=Aspergillus pseudoustus TaxID=1810923 RepID=A0ABR4IJZ3_9EURO
MKASRGRSSFLLAAALSISAVQAQNATTLTATGCVDSSGMEDCLNTANSRWNECTSNAGNDQQVIACSWGQSTDQIACTLQSCWNKVYSCEYQVLVGSLLNQQLTQPANPIPFWPAPDNAPGGCDCNFGQIYENSTANLNLISTLCPQYTGSLSNALTICQCCAWSAAVTAFYGICPGYDLSTYGLASLDQGAINNENIGGSCAGLTSDICLGEFGIGSADEGTYYDPASLPAGGTKVLSTTTGPGLLTTPPGYQTTTVTLLSEVYTVTAAAYNAKDVGAGTGSGSSSSSDDDNHTSSGSGGTSSNSSNSGSDTKGNSASGLWVWDSIPVGVLGVREFSERKDE